MSHRRRLQKNMTEAAYNYYAAARKENKPVTNREIKEAERYCVFWGWSA